MYVRTSEALGPVPTSYLFDSLINGVGLNLAQTRLGLAQTPAPVPKCVQFPKHLKLLPHFHIRKELVNNAWSSSITPVSMAPQFMDPGFLDLATGTFRTDPTLDPKLKRLLGDLKANKPPFDKEPYKTFASSGAKISVALVDLSSSEKLILPKFAECRSTVETVAASLAKIAALYAAHQLRFDLNHEAKQNPLSITEKRLAGLQKIFDATRVGGATPVWNFDFNAKLREALKTLCSNCSASFVISALGMTYISSVLRQSGLYDCRLGGLWIGSTYADKVEIREKCPDITQLVAQFAHQHDPIGGLLHGVTALSAAAFFTLLAQGRLVDDAARQSMKNMLVHQKDNGCPSRFEEGLRTAGLGIDSDKVFSKIGVLPSKVYCSTPKACCGQPISRRSKDCRCTCFIHEAALIERVHGTKPLRYVAAVLTESKPGAGGNDLLIDIIAKLDELIRNNP